MIFHTMKWAPVNVVFALFLSIQLSQAGSGNDPNSQNGACPFQTFSKQESALPEQTPGPEGSPEVSDAPLEKWAAKWAKVPSTQNKEGGLSYRYFVGLRQPERFFDDPKNVSSLKDFSPAEIHEWIDQPMQPGEILRWFHEFGEALCPKTLKEWELFKRDFSDGTLIQKRIGELKNEARAQSQKYPLFAEMLVDYCAETSPFKANPQWRSCTDKMTKLVHILAASPSPSRMPGVKNLAYASSDEKEAFRSLFQLPAVGARYFSSNERENPWLILVTSLRKVLLDESRLTEEDAANYRQVMESHVHQFRENVLKLDPDAFVVYTDAVDIEINSFPLGGRVMVLSVTPSCVNLIQMPVIGRSQTSSAEALKKAIAGNIYRSYFVALISQCSNDPITGKKLDRPIIFGEAFKAVNSDRLDQDVRNRDVHFNSWKPANSSHLCASCHADAFKEPIAVARDLPFVDSDSLAKMKLRVKERLGTTKKLPTWVSKWPVENDSSENLLFDRSMTDGPDLAFKNTPHDNAIIEETLDSCLPEDRRGIKEYREYIKNNMRCGKCHYEGGRSQGMRGPLKVRLPGSWGFNRGPITVDVSAMHTELLFSVTLNNPTKPGLLMPPSRRIENERFTTEGPDLERCLFQAYFGPFLRLEPLAGRHFSADWINSLPNRSVLGEWLVSGQSCE